MYKYFHFICKDVKLSDEKVICVSKKEARRKDYNYKRNSFEDISSEGNGKELVLASSNSNSLIPMSDDEFKDF